MKTFHKITGYTLLFLLVTFQNSFSADVLKIVTTTTSFADIAKNIGGDKVSVKSLTRGNQDLHAIEPRPSMVMDVKSADILIVVGMDLDMWVKSLADSARNPRVMIGSKGYVDASVNIPKLNIPAKVDASMGDIHIYGNPHYWLSPENGRIISKTIFDKMAEAQPSNAGFFRDNYKRYIEKLNLSINKWKELLKPYEGVKIVTYHDSWPYFAKEFGLSVEGFIEPKPGISPSPSHVLSLEAKIKSAGIKLIFVEPIYDLRAAEKISKDTGVGYAVVASSVGAVNGTDSYLEMFDYNVQKMVEVLSK